MIHTLWDILSWYSSALLGFVWFLRNQFPLMSYGDSLPSIFQPDDDTDR